ncbi:hypothetical protein [Chromobacterium vaccinii]|uniref:hypothetical protein n=1 Tax=Chromobacterium vaccinii TaxID=1108595 RepID=UPI0031E3346D
MSKKLILICKIGDKSFSIIEKEADGQITLCAIDGNNTKASGTSIKEITSFLENYFDTGLEKLFSTRDDQIISKMEGLANHFRDDIALEVKASEITIKILNESVLDPTKKPKGGLKLGK